MQNLGQNLLSKNVSQYSLETIFSQLYHYKCFEVNLKKALLMEDYSKLAKVYLINGYWFNQWKKVTCYEAIKDELSPYFNLQQNYGSVLNNYLKVVSKLCVDEKLENEIDNNYLLGNFDAEMNRTAIDEETEFEVISKDVWDNFAPSNTNNVNQGTGIEMDMGVLTADSLIIHLSSKTCYIYFWQREKQKIGKVILIFNSKYEKMAVANDIINNFGSFGNYYACNLEDLGEEKNINFQNFKYKCINKSDIILSYEEYKKLKTPVGLDNIRLVCYMNAGLQSLYNTPKLTQYFISNRKKIENNPGWELSVAYLEIVLNLSRMAKGSKKKSSFPPKKFFEIISIEDEFKGYAGDSSDLIRYFFEKVHMQLNHLNPQEINAFKKYYYNMSSNNNVNFSFQNKILKLNQFLDNYSLINNSIICNTFYYIEKTEFQCMNCQNYTYNFCCKQILTFSLEDVRKKVYNINNNNNQMFNAGMMNNNNKMINNNFFMNNMNMNNMNMNMNNMNMNMNNMNMNNMNMNNMNMNMNNMNMNMNNMNMNNMNMNNMNMNNMNMNNMNMNNMNMNNMNMNNMNMNMNNMNMNNMNMNNQMMNSFNNNNNLSYDKTPITLQQCFEFYINNKTLLNGSNCEICKNINTSITQLNGFYSLPDVLVINLFKGKNKKYPVKISYPMEIDLNQYVESNLDNNYYYLRSIITHIGEAGTGGHYIAFCFLEDKQKWYKFNDSQVTETDFNKASTFGDSYILFYKRKEN